MRKYIKSDYTIINLYRIIIGLEPIPYTAPPEENLKWDGWPLLDGNKRIKPKEHIP